MDMYFSAKTQTLVQFKEIYDKRLLNETPKNGSPVIFCAMANQTPQNRYDIVSFLMDEGEDLNGTNEEGETLFHILFSRPKHIMEQTVELTLILIDEGVDINQLDAKHRVAIQYLISHPKFTDEDFAPLYDVIFKHKKRLGLYPHRACTETPIPCGITQTDDKIIIETPCKILKSCRAFLAVAIQFSG